MELGFVEVAVPGVQPVEGVKPNLGAGTRWVAPGPQQCHFPSSTGELLNHLCVHKGWWWGTGWGYVCLLERSGSCAT